MLETVNRLIFQEVYAELKQSDQSVSQQPGLLAHPSAVMQMPECNLDQLTGERFTNLMQKGYVVINDFFAYREASQLLRPVMANMFLLEMESKFTIRRPRYAADELTRVDKFLDFNLSQLEGNEDLAILNKLAKLQFFIPYEINKKAQLNLQVSEQFQMSFVDKDHSFIKRRADSVFGKHDSGFKLTMLFVVGVNENQ